MFRRKSLGFIGLLFMASMAFGRSDDYTSYNRPLQIENYQEFRQPIVKIDPNRFQRFAKDFFDGGSKGLYVIKQPNFANILGQVATGLSPASIVADMRDFGISSVRAAKSGFKEHKTEMAMSAAGFIPLFGDMGKMKALFRGLKTEKIAIEAAQNSKYLRQTLPDLPEFVRNNFTHVQPITLKQGDFIYRSAKPGESAFYPGRYFAPKRNLNDVLWKYEVQKDVTVYHGVTKHSGVQIVIPHDIESKEVVRWVGTINLREPSPFRFDIR